MTRKKGPLSKTKQRAQFSQLLSEKKFEEARRLPSPKQRANKVRTIQATKNAPLKGTKQTTLIPKSQQTVKGTKESEPFKHPRTHESAYEKWRDWIEDNGYDRQDAERKMQESGQPMTPAQMAILDQFEADGAFSDVEVERDFDRERLTA